ncbi:MAG: hypothetical protein HQ570_01680 [Candidatus Omnitrophica bacterium]|nr:hypothetical protein [Candidatus Omnitrophota bacterium]
MATHIKQLVDKFLAKKKEEYKEQERIQQIVSRFLDFQDQEGVCFKGIFNKEIVLKSTASSFSYDFRLKKDKILIEIKKEFPQIKDIRIEIG